MSRFAEFAFDDLAVVVGRERVEEVVFPRSLVSGDVVETQRVEFGRSRKLTVFGSDDDLSPR